MDKSFQKSIRIDDQRRMWNRWNAEHRENNLAEVSARQAVLVEQWLRSIGRRHLDLIEVGCGSGWLCERLLLFGRVTGIDLADEVIVRARKRVPAATFVAGDFACAALPESSFDAVVTLEVLSHVADQPAFVARLARLLRPGGYLMMATQNRFILERWSAIGQPLPGQIRRWVDARGIRRLLRPHFDISELTSVLPAGNRGILRVINSVQLSRLGNAILGPARVERVKERLLLGQTLMVLARKRSTPVSAFGLEPDRE